MIGNDVVVNVSVAQIDYVIETLRRVRRNHVFCNRERSEIDHIIAALIDVKNSGREKDVNQWIPLLPHALRLLAEFVPAVKELFDSLR